MKYAVVTPAYNEASNLPRLYQSITTQRLLPDCWVIVDDGSSDVTGTVIDQFASEHTYIKPVHLNRDHVVSYYARKVHAFRRGVEHLNQVCPNYAILGCLDADIELPPDYYENLIARFSEDPSLGVAGGSFVYSDSSERVIWGGNYVSAAMLLARRECYEQVEGFRPLRYGAEDTLLCIMAESKGWCVKYYPEFEVVQHRVVGTAQSGILAAMFGQGLSEYCIGYHPLFSLIKFLKRMVQEKPYLIGSMARYLGYLLGPFFASREYVPRSAIEQLHTKQKERVKNLWRHVLQPKPVRDAM